MEKGIVSDEQRAEMVAKGVIYVEGETSWINKTTSEKAEAARLDGRIWGASDYEQEVVSQHMDIVCM